MNLAVNSNKYAVSKLGISFLVVKTYLLLSVVIVNW